MTALEYIQSRGLDYQMQSGQAVLKVCPFCGDAKGHFYMDPEEGLFHCHKCQESGNLITLQKHFGDYEPTGEQDSFRLGARKAQGTVRAAFPSQGKNYYTRPEEKTAQEAYKALMDDFAGLDYLKGRGFSLETVKHFKLGLHVDKDGWRWLSIPHFEKGQLENIKYRSLPPAEKSFRRIRGGRSVLFNADCIQGNQAELFLCEGETDLMALWNAGIKNVVATTTGAGSFDPAWIDQLAKVEKIILVYDSDEAGQRGAREVAKRLGFERCLNVVLPEGMDVNDYFLSGNTAEDFREIAGEGKPFDVVGVLTFSEGLRQLRETARRPEQAQGLKTGFPNVDRILRKGFQPGELIVLSAPPKIGKSTWALQVVIHNALNRIPSLFFCLEMRPSRIVQKIVQCQTRVELIGPAEITAAESAFYGVPLYLGYSHQKPTLEGIISTLKQAIKRYGLGLVAFDHLHFLCRSISNQVQEIGQAVQAFKFLAEEMEIPVLVIAQPRKIQPDSIMTAQDLKDSSSIFSDCDHLIILHRARAMGNGNGRLATEAFNPETLVRIEASRYSAGGEALLHYRGEISLFEGMGTDPLS